ncbi:predicted protein [Sparassis crispa]|uniref:Uncharacterized protein n=1 Tax=Sparassis crispa TaxID=139825 RepID=A0A401GZV4_9APHY|nr:predicted protein [Sparassis crispa]GBE87688.1 predicted protein [Sparassis crispa]
MHPHLFVVNDHPKNPFSEVGMVYVYVQDMHVEVMEKLFDWAGRQQLPGLTAEQARLAGYVEMKPGDSVFARDMWGSGQLVDDVIQAWYVPSYKIRKELINAIIDSRDELLGPKELCTADKAVKLGDSYTGVLLYLGPILPRNLASPSPGAKVYGDVLTPHQQMRKRAVQAATKVAIQCLETGPPEVSEVLKRNADVKNLPPLGADDSSDIYNYTYPTVQLNISSTKNEDEYAESNFQEDLGKFAGNHIDKGDWPGAYTVMIGASDLGPDDYPDIFCLFDIGIFVEMGNIPLLCFGGVRHHGGTPPTSSNPSGDSYRVAFINYPPKSQMEDHALLGLAAMPDHKLLTLRPEMIDPHYDNTDIVYMNEANWATDGLALSDRKAFFHFYTRGIAQRRWTLTSSWMEVDGEHVTPGPWELGPGSTAYLETFETTRADAVKSWDHLAKTRAAFIPYLAEKKKGGAGSDSDSDEEPAATGDIEAVIVPAKPSGRPLPKNIEQHISDGYEPDKDDNDEDNYDQEPRNTEQTPQTRKKKQPSRKVLASFYVYDESVEEREQDPMNSDQVTESENDSDIDDTVHTAVLSLFKKRNIKASHSEFSNILQGIQQQSHQKYVTAQQKLTRFLNKFNGQQHPNAQFAVSISQIWESMEVLSIKGKVISLENILAQKQIMLSNGVAWHWLNVICLQRCQELFEPLHARKLVTSSDWFTSLTIKIYQHFEISRRSSNTLNPSTYLPGLPKSIQPWKLPVTNALNGDAGDSCSQHTALSPMQLAWLSK